MSGSLPEFSALSHRCQEHLAEITDSLNSCFEQNWELTLGEPIRWEQAGEIAGPLTAAGVVVAFILGEQGGYLLALPESLPLPVWASEPDPDIEQQVRLQKLALACQSGILPEDWQDCTAHAQPTQDLATVIQWSSPLADAQVLPLYVEHNSAPQPPPQADGTVAAEAAETPMADADEAATADSKTDDSAEAPTEAAVLAELPEPPVTSTEGRSAFYLIGPVETPPAQLEVESPTSAGFEEADFRAAEEDPFPFEGAFQEADQSSAELLERIRRLLPLKVPVSVRLAEMKIEMSSLINLSPGMLLVFPKSCDDLLDLYVNNKLYAQGEAVKIGEKFGLKINDVGTQKQRKPGIFTL